MHALGPKAVLVTSLHTDETPADAIDLVASDASGRFRVRTPKLPISVNGAGDAIAALFFAHYLRTGSAAEALSRAASSVFGLLKRTADAGSREILLIDAQDEFVNPSRVFAAETQSEEHLMRRRFVTLDVFTDKRFAGNPLAVVLEPDGLDTAAMQTIAREFNLSETVFVFPPADKANRAKLRIFTPARELPFAGHPTVGTAVLLGRIDGGGARDLHAGRTGRARAVPGDVIGTGQRAARRSIFRACPPRRRDSPDVAAMAAALGLSVADIGLRRLRGRSAGRRATRSPSCRCAGSTRSDAAASISRASSEAFGGGAHAAAFVFCRETAEPGHAFHARMFAPRHGRARGPRDRVGGRGVRGLSGGARRLHRRRAPRRHRAGLRDGARRARSSSR